MKHGLALFLGLLLLAGCRQQDTYPPLGLNMASPVDLAMSDDGRYFYVLNADFDRTYNIGSIVTMDQNGNKLSAVQLPRMGRALAIGGPNATDLVATADVTGDDYHTLPHAYLYDLSADPTTPTLKATFELPFTCGPWNVTMRKGYQHFAVTCLDGSLFIGTLTADRTQSTLWQVRQYGVTRRALYLDPKRELLLAFPTDPGKGTAPDQELQDVAAFIPGAGDTLTQVNVPNEVPDSMENNPRVLANTQQRESYQFVVYDIAHERALGFPWRDNTDPIYQTELRWMYYRVANFDGSPDQTQYYYDPTFRFYRTNFYDVQPDPDDPDAFYLSHRGAPNTSPWANDVVRVNITGDLHAYSAPQGAANRLFPFTSDVMKFTRVYGFRGPEASKFDYTGSIKIATIEGQKVILVNNFRDLINWVRDDAYFSVAAQTLGDNASWYSEEPGGLGANDPRTYYQVAVNSSGRLASCSFYGNSVVLLDVRPGLGIYYVNTIQ